MKRNLLILLALITLGSLFAQGGYGNIDDMIFADPAASDTVSNAKSLRNDIITVNYARKDARKAMLFSMILPGAGQFYADKSAIQTYIYPVIELALIGGMIYFNQKGNELTKDYEKYATGENITTQIGDFQYTGPRYRREYQNNVQSILIAYNTADIYDGSFFRLDANNTQHFYEDIGKYDKYIFGWADWYHTFAANDGVFVLGNPGFESAFVMSSEDFSARWLGNHTIENIIANDFSQQVTHGAPSSSPMREEYIRMRKDAEKEYSTGHLLSFGLVANHLVSAIEAVTLTNRVNRMSISQSPFQLNYYASLRDMKFTPTVNLSYRF